MGFYLQEPYQAPTQDAEKNRVWGFEVQIGVIVRHVAAQPVESHQEKHPTVTKTVSGIPVWLSRDPIGERGGLNLYGFVGNDGLNRWDYLGLEDSWWDRLSDGFSDILHGVGNQGHPGQPGGFNLPPVPDSPSVLDNFFSGATVTDYTEWFESGAGLSGWVEEAKRYANEKINDALGEEGCEKLRGVSAFRIPRIEGTHPSQASRNYKLWIVPDEWNKYGDKPKIPGWNDILNLGSFSFYWRDVSLDWSSHDAECRNTGQCYGKVKWTAELKVIDSVGLQPRDGRLHDWFGGNIAKCKNLKLGSWDLEGAIYCPCPR